MSLDNMLIEHKALIKKKAQQAELDREQSVQFRERIWASVAIISLFIAAGEGVFLHRYAMSVVVRDQVRTVDARGQVIAETGAIYQIPAESQTHAFITNFITDLYTVYNSPAAVQRNYIEAQSFVDKRSNVLPVIKDFLLAYSPLRPDLSWDRSRDTERIVNMTSILDRGKWSEDHSAEEYDVEWTVTPIGSDGHPGSATSYRAVVAVNNGADRTDANPFGLLIAHFAATAQQ